MTLKYVKKIKGAADKDSDFKIYSHLTPAFAFFFDLCCPVLQNVNVKCDFNGTCE